MGCLVVQLVEHLALDLGSGLDLGGHGLMPHIEPYVRLQTWREAYLKAL